MASRAARATSPASRARRRSNRARYLLGEAPLRRGFFFCNIRGNNCSTASPATAASRGLTTALVYQCAAAIAGVGSDDDVQAHIRLLLLVLLTCLTVEPARAAPECDDGYGMCMAACAVDRSPERCMQRCQEAAMRCSKSGVFRMPVGFLLNKARLEDMARAQGELPLQIQRPLPRQHPRR